MSKIDIVYDGLMPNIYREGTQGDKDHEAARVLAITALDGLIDREELIGVVEGMKRKVNPLPKHRLGRPCEITAHNNNKIHNNALNAVIEKLRGDK